MMALPEWVDVPRRKNPRARGFDYRTPGMYMLTQCMQDRRPKLGRVVEGRTELSDIGRMVVENLSATALRFEDTTIDCFCIMPDHLHLILALSLQTGRPGTSVVGFMRAFKTLAGRAYIPFLKALSGLPRQLFQRSCGDEIIEDEEELYAYRKYILENPLAYQLRLDGHR